MLVACTPPRNRDKHHTPVPHLIPRSRSDNLLGRQLTDNPVTPLYALLSKHALPSSSTYTSSFLVEAESSSPAPLLPPCSPGYSNILLPTIGRSLSAAAQVFSPQRVPLLPGPSRHTTDAFAEHLEGVSERAKLSSRAHNLLHQHITDTDFVVKFLLRPLNEIMQCMLLPLGVQVFWRAEVGNPRMQLVWRQHAGKAQTLAVMQVSAPHVVSDTDMHLLLDYVRRGWVHIGNEGRVVVNGGKANPAIDLAVQAVDGMLDMDCNFAVLTNCEHWVVVKGYEDEMRGTVVQFSSLVNVADKPLLHPSQSPLGLLLGLAVHALNKRGVDLNRRQPFSPPATLIFDNLVTEHFGPTASSKRASHCAKSRRRGVLGMGLNPSHLGAATLHLCISPSFRALLETHYNLPPSSLHWPASFHGPWSGPHLPLLLPETVTDTPWVPELELVEFKGAGPVWLVFCARFAWCNSPADLVVKICTRAEPTTHAVTTELAAYSALSDLQGSVVPRFRGLLGSSKQQWIALFDDAGYPLSPVDGTSAVQSTIRRHYRALHAAGVLHGNVAWRHILQHDDDIRLVNFERAVLRTTEGWDKLCADEMKAVDRMLNASLKAMAAEAYSSIHPVHRTVTPLKPVTPTHYDKNWCIPVLGST